MIGFLSVERSYPVLGSHLCGVAWDGHHLWYADAGTARLSCLDDSTDTLRQEVVCLEMRTGLTFDGTSLWQMAGHPKRIRVIDPADGRIVREIVLGEQAEGMAGLYVDGTSYWLGPEQEGRIEQHALGDNTVLATLGVVPSAEGITIIGSTLWYTSYRQRLLAAIDLKTGQEKQRYRLPGDPTGMCWDGTQLWYSDYLHRQLCAVHLPVLESDARFDFGDLSRLM